jgi:signal transduction histidine kinase
MQQHLLLATESGTVLIDTENQRNGQPLTSAEKSAAIQLNDGQGNLIGYLYTAGGMQFQPGADRDLVLKLNSAARKAALLAGGVAILLAMLLGYLILRPVKRLTLAANQIAGGDLSQRVPVKGKDELAELGKAFNTMTESLENAQETRKAMTSDIAHELRTPLAIQRAILEAIQDGVYPMDSEQIQHVYEQNQSLTRLVDDLRTLALADAGELKLEKVETDICGLMERTFIRFQPQAAQKNIQLRLEPCNDLKTVRVEIDPFRIDQVMNNLISNALRYSPAGSTVTGKIEDHGRDVTVAIRDQGEGIPQDEIDQIFERFFRTDRSRSREEGGTGLGLSIARQLARAHNGDLTVRNHPEGGAEFILRLPVS